MRDLCSDVVCEMLYVVCTISISPKLLNNSMGFQCWPTPKNIAKKAIRFISNAKYNSHTTPMFKNLRH